MKRIITGFMLAVIMSLALTACGNNSKNNSSASENRTDISTITDNNMQTQQENNNTMTMHFEDFNNTEKISYMDDKLDTSDAVTEYAPEAGSFGYYIPWGNLSLFYEDFRKSTGLAELGNVEEGIEYIKNMDKYESVTISVIE